MMTKAEVIEMYLDWACGRDDEIHQSDVIGDCLDNGFEYDEIEKLSNEKIKE